MDFYLSYYKKKIHGIERDGILEDTSYIYMNIYLGAIIPATELLSREARAEVKEAWPAAAGRLHAA